VRLSEAEAKSAEAVSLHRAGKIDEATAALRKAAADVDCADLHALIGSSAPMLATINESHQRCLKQTADAEDAARREEMMLTAADLDGQIAQIEQTFLAAMAERYRVHVAMKGTGAGQSTFAFYKPSMALDRLIRNNEPPRV